MPVDLEMYLEVLAPSFPAQKLFAPFLRLFLLWYGRIWVIHSPFSGWFLKRKSWDCWIDVIPIFRHSVTSKDYKIHLHRALVSTSVN